MISPLPRDENHLARLLLDVAGDRVGASGRPAWALVLNRPDGGTELAVRDDDFDPLGWLAPPDCAALAVVATGRVRPLGAAVELPSGLAAGRAGARVACVVSRSGRVGWHMVLPDGSAFDDPPEEGRVLDVLRRGLALPTPPPADRVDVLAALSWLGAVIDAARPDRLLSWRDTLALHPLLDSWSAALDPDDMVTVIRETRPAGSWEDLRRAVAGGHIGDEWVPAPHLAAWMDEGMFSRWVLGSLRDPEELLRRARPGLRPAAARRLAHLVRTAGRRPPEMRSAG